MPTLIEQSAPVRIQPSNDHGMTLVATKRLEPELPFGLHVFTDKALLIMPTRGSEGDNSGSPPEILKPGPQMWTDWWAFRRQPEHVRARILALYTDEQCPQAAAIREYLTRNQQKSQDEKQDDDFDKGILGLIDEFVRFTMVIRFNSVELNPPAEDGSGPGTDYGHGLFETACRMNHSCKPNCVWITTQDGTAKEVRAIKSIDEGEQLTVDYVGQTTEPIPQRRRELMITKGFTCECDRCSAAYDDTRRFRCVNQEQRACPGEHFLSQPDLSALPELLNCSHCGAVAPLSYLNSMLEKEMILVEEINALNKNIFDEVESQERIEHLDPPHSLHCLAEKCYELQGTFFAGRGDYKRAAEAYAKQLRCRTAILGDDYPSQTSAFCCERLGDALRHVNVDEAEEAYKRTVRHIHVLRGGMSDPYARCAIGKLMDIQHQRARSNRCSLPTLEAVAGIIASVPDAIGSSDSIESRCEMCGNPSIVYEEHNGKVHQYCCEQHKTLHVSVLLSCPEESKLCETV
jgi:SET domain